MPISGPLLDRAEKAILSAFTRDELSRAVRIHMEAGLEALAPNASLETQVHELLLWAGRTGSELELITALQSERPRNTELAAVAQELRSPQPPVANPANQQASHHPEGGQPAVDAPSAPASVPQQTGSSAASGASTSTSAPRADSPDPPSQIGFDLLSAGIAGALALMITNVLQVPEPWASFAVPLALVTAGVVFISLHWIWRSIRTYSLVFLPLLFLSLAINVYLLSLNWQGMGQTPIQAMTPHVMSFEEEDPPGSDPAAYLTVLDQNGHNSYRLLTNLAPGGAKDFAGYTYIFDTPQDLGQYKSVVVAAEFGADSQADFVLEGEQGGQRQWIRLGNNVTYPSTIQLSTVDGIQHITIPMQYFGQLDLKQIKKVSFVVDRHVQDGEHEFTVHDIRFVR